MGDVLKYTPGAVTKGSTVAFFTDTSLTTPTTFLLHRPASAAPIPTTQIKVGGTRVQAQVLTDQDASGVDGQVPAVYAPDGSTSPIYMAELDYNLTPVASTKQTLTGADPVGSAPGGTSVASTLTPTATKTAAYTVAVGELAMMNVAGGATVLTLPTAPADKAQVGYRAIGATPIVPLVVNRGGSDTIGTAGATTASIPLADEVAVLQYDAANTRWLGVANVKTQPSLDARYAPLSAKTTGPRLIQSYVLKDEPAAAVYAFPARVRPVEPNRKLLRIHNRNTVSCQVAYGTANNSSTSTPAAGQWTAGVTLAPGQSADLVGSSQAVFVRPLNNNGSDGIKVAIESIIGVS